MCRRLPKKDYENNRRAQDGEECDLDDMQSRRILVGVHGLLFAFVLQSPEIQFLDFCPCPRRLSQECQARLDAWVLMEAVDADAFGELGPTIDLDEIGEDRLKRLSVKGVVRLSVHMPIL